MRGATPATQAEILAHQARRREFMEREYINRLAREWQCPRVDYRLRYDKFDLKRVA